MTEQAKATVHCPRCGKAVSAYITVGQVRLTRVGLNQAEGLLVRFEDSNVVHECQDDEEAADEPEPYEIVNHAFQEPTGPVPARVANQCAHHFEEDGAGFLCLRPRSEHTQTLIRDHVFDPGSTHGATGCCHQVGRDNSGGDCNRPRSEHAH